MTALFRNAPTRPTPPMVVWSPPSKKKKWVGEGGRVPTPEISAAMYTDYCTGLTVAEVAAKWSVTTNAVYMRFRNLGVPLRRQTISGNLERANRRRTATTAPVMVEIAKAVLPGVRTEHQRRILQLRIDNPEATITGLAELSDPPVSRDVVASVLRRVRVQFEGKSSMS